MGLEFRVRVGGSGVYVLESWGMGDRGFEIGGWREYRGCVWGFGSQGHDHACKVLKGAHLSRLHRTSSGVSGGGGRSLMCQAFRLHATRVSVKWGFQVWV